MKVAMFLRTCRSAANLLWMMAMILSSLAVCSSAANLLWMMAMILSSLAVYSSAANLLWKIWKPWKTLLRTRERSLL